jgi:phosphoribosylglycinamide formyltransferase-1
MTRLRIGVLISGRGSNLRALIAACSAEAYPAEIALVISSRAEAPGLGIAAAAGVPVAVITHRERRAFAAEAQPLLCERRVELVCLAGFMRILDANFVEAWRNRMVNIHPSLLPSFRGLHPQRQALAAGARFAGCTVHFVRPELDCGPIIGQAVVPVHPDDDEARLSKRILETEHRLYPLAVRLIAERRVRVIPGVVAGADVERVEILNARIPNISALNPQDCPRSPACLEPRLE